jgi:hypothetical protein
MGALKARLINLVAAYLGRDAQLPVQLVWADKVEKANNHWLERFGAAGRT